MEILLVMYVLEICLFLIVLIAGISATITDLKNSIISNKMIVRMMGFSIPLSAQRYFHFSFIAIICGLLAIVSYYS